MIPDIRKRFNASFSPDRYERYLRKLDELVGMRIEFRISETPVFLSREMEEKLVSAATEILHQVSSPEYLRLSARSIPSDEFAPNESDHPEFVQVDFALTWENDGSVGLRLIELQGFPSIYATQELMGRVALEVYALEGLRHLVGGMSVNEYYELLRRVILRDHAPENVVLLEVDPLRQKTRPDFLWTEKIIGVRTVDITHMEKENKNLFYRDERGKRIRIDRIYNRAIIDELHAKKTRYAFSFTDELDLTWACHPNWYYRISKFSLPFIDHPAVPWASFLDSLDRIPDDLERYVLKPLYSFAGSGVIVSPTIRDIESIPGEHRSRYILQEKVEYAPVIDTPSGGTKAEIRVMFIWDDVPLPVNLLVRTGRGKMMGVGYNMNMDWVGATSGLVVTG